MTAPLRALLLATAARTGLDVERLTGRERRGAISRARFGFAWAAQQALSAPTTLIGRVLGQADHTSAIHAIRRANQLRDTDPAFRMFTDALADWAIAEKAKREAERLRRREPTIDRPVALANDWHEQWRRSAAKSDVAFLRAIEASGGTFA